MAEQLPPHQLMLGEEYWADPIGQPEIPNVAQIIDGFSNLEIFGQFGYSKVQDLYRHVNLQRDPMTIEADSRLPIPERGRVLLRVVEDHRLFPAPRSALAKMRSERVEQPSSEEFDRVANQMIIDRLYNGPSAQRTFEVEGAEREIRLQRIVYYLTGSKSGKQLEGVKSDSLSDKPSLANLTYDMLPKKVGRAYRADKEGQLLSRIALAEVLITNSSDLGKSRRRVPVKRLVAIPRLRVSF